MKNWNADEWHLFLCQHCDNRATSPNGLNKVALAIVDEIDEVTAAKRSAPKLADERAKEANELRVLVKRGLDAINAAIQQTQAEQLGHDRSADKYCRMVEQWRKEARAALIDEVREPRTGSGSLD